MTAPVVHIGYHKTATTWFQKAFYPLVRNARFIPRRTVQEALLDVTAFQFDPAEARRILGIARDEAVMLCEEGLSGYPHNGGLGGYLSKEMAHRIKAVLPDARIVIFIRSQPSVIAASYQQYVKGGGTFSPLRYAFPEAFLRGARSEFAKCPRFTFDHFDYAPLIAHYQAVFGPENVHVFPYEAFRRQPVPFLKDYAARLGLEINLDQVPLGSSNRSYGPPTLGVVRLLNRFTNRTVLDKHYLVHIPYWYGLIRGIGEGLNRLPLFGRSASPRRVLGQRISAWIEQRYWRSNQEVMQRTGLPLDRYGYPTQPPGDAVREPSPSPLISWTGN